MLHSEWDALLALYVAGDVSNDQKRQIETHLTTCAICQTKLQNWQTIKTTLQQESRAARQTLALPPLALNRIRESAPETPRRSAARPMRIPFSFVATLLVMVLFGMGGVVFVLRQPPIGTSLTITEEPPTPTPLIDATEDSPTAPLIAFTTMRDGNTEIYLMDANGEHVRNLTQNAAEDFSPAWSPDGRSLVFTSSRGSNPSDLYIMDVESGSVRQLTQTANVFDLDAAWSPDGQTIAFTGVHESGGSGIYLINVDGTNLRIPTGTPARDSRPTWSPNSQQLAFVSQHGGESQPQIYVMQADGSAIRPLILADQVLGDPAWSPDGQMLAYTTYRDERDQILVYDIAAQTSRLVWGEGLELAQPVWSADGQMLTFNERTNDNQQVCIIRIDGTGHRCLTEESINYMSRFQP